MVKLHFLESGESRWCCEVTISKPMVKEFFEWLEENVPQCHVKFIKNEKFIGTQQRTVIEYYQIRSGDSSTRSMLAIRWGGMEDND